MIYINFGWLTIYDGEEEGYDEWEFGVAGVLEGGKGKETYDHKFSEYQSHVASEVFRYLTIRPTRTTLAIQPLQESVNELRKGRRKQINIRSDVCSEEEQMSK